VLKYFKVILLLGHCTFCLKSGLWYVAIVTRSVMTFV